MPDKDIVLAKVAAIQRCLRRIKDGTGLDPALLDELDAQDIFVLNLQRAIQSAIDLGTHVIASEGLGIPETIRGNFILLEHAKIITKTLSGEMGRKWGHIPFIPASSSVSPEVFAPSSFPVPPRSSPRNLRHPTVSPSACGVSNLPSPPRRASHEGG